MNISRLICSIFFAGLLVGCAATEPPPLPQYNPADPQVRSVSKAPRNVLVRDETTLAIEKQLSATEADAKSAESMKHDMNNMPGIQHGDMQGMQHEGMKMEDHKDMPNEANVDLEKKAVADEMKTTSDEMKKTSEEMKQKSEQTSPQNFYYTCRMHPQIHADKPGKCPICGMTLIKKEEAPPK